ncbi:MAG: hypothetical protein V1885_02410 [Candidatus Brennerbacteria bacterium]
MEESRNPVAEEQLVYRTPFVVVANAALAMERVRVGAEVRLAHLMKRGESCADTEELLRRSWEIEQWADKRLNKLLRDHPAYAWLKKIKGAAGGEVIGKVLGNIENFGRFYDLDDPMLPKEIYRDPVTITVEPKNGTEAVMQTVVWVEAIERFTTPSKLRKYSGLMPGLRREAGKKLPFNMELKTMLWRLGNVFLRQQNKYHEFYTNYKAYLVRRFEKDGIRVIPTPKGRLCQSCGKESTAKAARYCPECGGPLSLKREPEGVRYEMHVHLMAQRRMLQLFLDHLWVVWREANGLSIREPYPIEYGGHTTVISPWDMADKD